jgi:hypothetical protein
MKIIIEIDIFFGEIALIGLIDEYANGIEVESRRGEERSRPELNERRMLWVDTKIGVAHVGDACGNVIRLVDGEAIKAGGYGGTHDRSTHQQKQHQNEEA